MVELHCFDAEWIRLTCRKGLKAHPHIVEKSIRALALLDHLARRDMAFVFKGGTSLLLHLSPIRRLSIDIDIVCRAPEAELDRTVRDIKGLQPFLDCAEDDRGNRGLPKRRHFRFTYDRLPKGDPRPVILLDVVEERECNLPLTEKPIHTEFIETTEDTLVTVPTVEGLLGDKLTAFAPNTIGVPFERPDGASQALQVAKQMFDVGELFSAATNTAQVVAAYDASFHQESGYRGDVYSKEAVLRDTIDTCYRFCGQLLRRFPKEPDSIYLIDGTTALQNHLVNHRFHPQFEAKIAAAKAACTAALVLSGDTDRDIAGLKFAPEVVEELRKLELTGDLAPLNRLKKANPEAFHYWTVVQDILS
jgi:hypothetical protein